MVTEYPFDITRVIGICRDNDVSMLGVFESMARGDATEHSDVDLLVRFFRTKSLLTLVRIEREISDAIGLDVDLLTEASISPYLLPRILADLHVIYEA